MPNKDILLEGDGTQGQAAVPSGKHHLLVIAIDDYAHCPKLNNCVKDAQELIEVLDTKYGIPIDDTVLPPLFNSQATRENITRSFRKLAEKVAPEDSVLIYFSGHGEYDSVFKQGYWVPVEGERGKVNTYLPNSEVRVFLEAINSHHTFLMVDSCFSGTLFVDKSADKNVQRLEQDPSRWCLTSGRKEIVSDGEAGKNSPFAESLLYRLRQNTGNLGVMQLCTLVLEQVAANALQSPRGEPLKVEGHKGGQFYFKPKKEDEELFWKKCLEQANTASFQEYLSRFPAGAHRTEAQELIKALAEESAWEKASQSGSIDGLLDFLEKFPQTRFRKEARIIIDYQEDLRDWQAVAGSEKIADYLEYKEKHPSGGFLQEADERIATLRSRHKESDAWRKAQNEHSVLGYQRYLEEHPNGANAVRARAALDALKQEEHSRTARAENEAAEARDRQAWEKATQEHTIAAYQRYLSGGHARFRAEAERAIAGLEKSLEAQKEEKLKAEKLAAGSPAPPGKGSGGTAEGHPRDNQASEREKTLKQLGFGAVAVLLVIALIWRPWEPIPDKPKPIVENNDAEYSEAARSSTATLAPPPENMVLVRGGTFTMGCTSEQGSDCDGDEKPAHQVTVSDFYIGKYEVTQKEWREVMGSNPSFFKNCDACPVENVSWNDVQSFLSKLNAKTGRTYRLPTEAEWEYAARGGSQSRGYKYAGSNSLDEVAWYGDNSGSKTHPVGQKKANELGLYDMSGNVWEWCADDWHDSYSGAPSTGRAWIDSPRASDRVHRGGSWYDGARYSRVSSRLNFTPSDRFFYLGFRLAL